MICRTDVSQRDEPHDPEVELYQPVPSLTPSRGAKVRRVPVAVPLSVVRRCVVRRQPHVRVVRGPAGEIDRKSTRLNSSHSQISYAVFCLKKKKAIEVLARP